MRGMDPPPKTFKNVFDLSQFFHQFGTSSIAISLTPKHVNSVIENVWTKCIIFGEALRLSIKTFNQNLSANYSKSTKIAIAASHVNYSKFFQEACPRTCFSISYKFELPKKIPVPYAWKNVRFSSQSANPYQRIKWSGLILDCYTVLNYQWCFVSVRAGARAVELGGSNVCEGRGSLNLSTKAAVFKRESFLKGGGGKHVNWGSQLPLAPGLMSVQS